MALCALNNIAIEEGKVTCRLHNRTITEYYKNPDRTERVTPLPLLRGY